MGNINRMINTSKSKVASDLNKITDKNNKNVEIAIIDLDNENIATNIIKTNENIQIKQKINIIRI